MALGIPLSPVALELRRRACRFVEALWVSDGRQVDRLSLGEVVCLGGVKGLGLGRVPEVLEMVAPLTCALRLSGGRGISETQESYGEAALRFVEQRLTRDRGLQ